MVGLEVVTILRVGVADSSWAFPLPQTCWDSPGLADLEGLFLGFVDPVDSKSCEFYDEDSRSPIRS